MLLLNMSGREILPLRAIISEEMQLRLSSMQVDVFALVTEARQRIRCEECDDPCHC